MSDKKQEIADKIANLTAEFLNLSKEEVKEEVKLESELAAGEYELKDGTTFRIDEAGNLVDVTAPTVDEAEREEARKDAEDAAQRAAAAEEVAMEKHKEELETKANELKEANEKLEALELQVAELTKTPKISVAPPVVEKPKAKEVKGNLAQRASARMYNQRFGLE